MFVRNIQLSVRKVPSRMNPLRCGFSSEARKDGSAHTTTPIEKMKTDARYRATSSVPEKVLMSMHANEAHTPGFSIKGDAIEGRPAYLDFQSTTPTDPRVLDAMMPYMIGRFGNPHSKTHTYGWETESAVEVARAHIAALIGASPQEIVFTSGATESNNTAIKGLAHFYGSKKRHIITTQTEHKCVLDACRVLETEGFEVTYLPVQQNGLIDLDVLKAAIRADTVCVSIMGVHNEIGVIQPLAEIGAICRANKVFFHSDLAQMAGKVPVDVNELNIDVASLSSHKMYGPKGCGALYVRRKPRVRIEPLIHGGGQERGLRSGTLAPALCVGFGEAARICKEDMEFDTQWVNYLSNKLKTGIMNRISDVVLNGDENARYKGNLNFSFAYVEGESMLMALKNIAVSSGSACTSASLEPSYVLRAIGTDDEMAHSSIRFGIGRFTTEQEIDFAINLLEKHIGRLREMSPLWEMVQEGIDLKTIVWAQDSAHHH
jgi:cysteine desulfurase